jgi:hypothetical protein
LFARTRVEKNIDRIIDPIAAKAPLIISLCFIWTLLGSMFAGGLAIAGFSKAASVAFLIATIPNLVIIIGGIVSIAIASALVAAITIIRQEIQDRKKNYISQEE